MSRPIYCPNFVSTESVTRVNTYMDDVGAPVIVLSGKFFFYFSIKE